MEENNAKVKMDISVFSYNSSRIGLYHGWKKSEKVINARQLAIHNARSFSTWFSMFIDELNEREWPESREEKDFRRKIEMESREKPIKYTKSHWVGKLLLDIIDLRERAEWKRGVIFLNFSVPSKENRSASITFL